MRILYLSIICLFRRLWVKAISRDHAFDNEWFYFHTISSNILIIKSRQKIIGNFYVTSSILTVLHCITAKRSIWPLSSAHYSTSPVLFFPLFCPLALPFTSMSTVLLRSTDSWHISRGGRTKTRCIYLWPWKSWYFSCWRRKWWLNWVWEGSNQLASWLISNAKSAVEVSRLESSHILHYFQLCWSIFCYRTQPLLSHWNLASESILWPVFDRVQMTILTEVVTPPIILVNWWYWQYLVWLGYVLAILRSRYVCQAATWR